MSKFFSRPFYYCKIRYALQVFALTDKIRQDHYCCIREKHEHNN